MNTQNEKYKQSGTFEISYKLQSNPHIIHEIPHSRIFQKVLRCSGRLHNAPELDSEALESVGP